jgi:DNA-binding response OmpR family regulator
MTAARRLAAGMDEALTKPVDPARIGAELAAARRRVAADRNDGPGPDRHKSVGGPW